MATHSSILASRIPWTEEPDGLYAVHGVAKSWTELSQGKHFSYRRLMELKSFKNFGVDPLERLAEAGLSATLYLAVSHPVHRVPGDP